MMKGRLERKLWAVVLTAAMLLSAAPVAWAEDAPANERVYYTTFTEVYPDHAAYYYQVYSTRSTSSDSYDVGSSALMVVDNDTENFGFTGVYPDMGSVSDFYSHLQAGKSYIFSTMIKVLPYHDEASDTDYTLTLQPQINFDSTVSWEYGTAFGRHITSDEGWQRLIIPFTLPETYSAQNFQFLARNRKADVNPALPVDHYIAYVMDQIAIYEPAPVALTASSIENGATGVSANSITFSFNNVMDDTTVTKAANYMLTNNSISSVVNNGNGSYTATFANALTAGEQHTFTMSNLKDELGQDLAQVSITFTAAQETEPVDPEVPGENTLLYRNTFSNNPPEHISWCFQKTAETPEQTADAVSGGSALKITGRVPVPENWDEPVAGFTFYYDNEYNGVKFYDNFKSDTNYVASVMMKALPYNDGAKDYPVTYQTQIVFKSDDTSTEGVTEGLVSGPAIPSDGQWHRVLIPFNTGTYAPGFTNFAFQVLSAREELGNDEIPADVTYFAEYIVDDFELYQAAPVALTETSIADGAEDVSAAAEGITFSFNNVMDDTTVTNTKNYTLTDNTISEVVKNDNGSYTATFGSPLVENKTYTFNIRGLKDELQQEMAADSITFTTTEAGAPQVLSTTPEYNAINVATDTTMTVRFDTAVANVTKDNVLVNGSNKTVANVTTNGTNEAEITFAGLDYGTLYEVTLTGVTGTTGKVMDDYTTQFVTELESKVVYENRFVEDEDFIFPKWRDSGCIPNVRNDAEYVSAPYSVLMQPTNTNRDLYFSENYATFVPGKTYRVSVMAKSTAEENQGFKLLANVDEQIILDTGKLSTEWKEYSATFVQPNNPNPGRFQNYDNVPYYIDDLIITEVAPTQVLPNSDIVDGAQDVSVSGPYTLYFNNAIDTASLTGITINGTAVTVTGTGTTENTVTFTPAAALAYDSINTLQINVKDAGGADVAYTATFQAAGAFTVGQMQLLAGQTVVEDSTLAPNTTYTATLSALTNNADTASDAVVLIALYDGGTMVAADFAEVTLDGGASIDAPLTAEITSPASFAGTPTLKAFLWNGFDNIAPIADYIAVTGAAQ